MHKDKTRNLLFILIWGLSLALLIWTQWPIKTISREIVFHPGDLLIPAQSSAVQEEDPTGSVSSLAFMDTRKIILTWTPMVRKGDHAQIRLRFVDDNTDLDGYLNSTMNSGFGDIFDNYSVNAIARVELPDLIVTPEGISGQVLPEDGEINFIWKITSQIEGSFEGITWSYLQYFPRKGGEFMEKAIAVQPFELKVVSILGLNSNYWRFIGIFGLMIGIYLQKEHIFVWISRTYRQIIHKTDKLLNK